MLDAFEGLQGPLWRDSCVSSTKARAHDTVQYQRHKAILSKMPQAQCGQGQRKFHVHIYNKTP